METPVKRPVSVALDRTYSGYAAEDLETGSQTLAVTIPELQPHATFGTLAAGITQGNTTLSDRDGNALSAPVNSANHIVATWQGESNRRYPPKVRKGEPVEIFQRASQDKFFWKATGFGRDARTTDHLAVEVAATDPTKPAVAKDDTNTYTAGIDTDGKKIYVKTSKANGEKVAFSVEIDTDKGTFHISDDSKDPGNRVFMDTGVVSGTPIIQMNNQNGTAIKVQGDDLFIKVPGTLGLSAGNRIVLDAPLFVFGLKATGTFIINTANFAVNAARDAVLKAGGVIGLNAASVKAGGVLLAASARIGNAVKGPVSGSYTGASISKPQDGQPTIPSNSPDTSVAGLPYKTV